MNWLDDVNGTLPRLTIPIGPRFQVVVPDWMSYSNDCSYYVNNELDTQKWLGTRSWPIEDMDMEIKENVIGQGKPNICPCAFPGSVKCIKRHIIEKNTQLRYNLGPAFWSWKFDEMGEEVSKRWTLKDQEIFEHIVKRKSSLHGKSFLKLASECLPFMCRENIVSYYFNVYVLRRISMQIRAGYEIIDTDDEAEKVLNTKYSRKRYCVGSDSIYNFEKGVVGRGDALSRQANKKVTINTRLSKVAKVNTPHLGGSQLEKSFGLQNISTLMPTDLAPKIPTSHPSIFESPIQGDCGTISKANTQSTQNAHTLKSHSFNNLIATSNRASMVIEKVLPSLIASKVLPPIKYNARVGQSADDVSNGVDELLRFPIDMKLDDRLTLREFVRSHVQKNFIAIEEPLEMCCDIVGDPEDDYKMKLSDYQMKVKMKMGKEKNVLKAQQDNIKKVKKTVKGMKAIVARVGQSADDVSNGVDELLRFPIDMELDDRLILREFVRSHVQKKFTATEEPLEMCCDIVGDPEDDYKMKLSDYQMKVKMKMGKEKNVLKAQQDNIEKVKKTVKGMKTIVEAALGAQKRIIELRSQAEVVVDTGKQLVADLYQEINRPYIFGVEQWDVDEAQVEARNVEDKVEKAKWGSSQVDDARCLERKC